MIAAGTGLGEGALIATPSGYFAVASEGGHRRFRPARRGAIRLLEFLQREFDHVSFERVISGPGLHNIYRFVVSRTPGPEPAWLADRHAQPKTRPAVIGETAIAGSDARCVHALELFTAIYGAEAANLALKYLALGGVYLCGGIGLKFCRFCNAAG